MHDYTLENAKCHESPTEFSKVSSAWEITSEIAGIYAGFSQMDRISVCAERAF